MRKEEYLKSIRSKRFRVYLEGEELENVVDHPRFQTVVKIIERSYELPHDFSEMMVYSPLVNKEVGLWATVLQTKEHLTRFMEAIKKISCRYLCTNCMPGIFNCVWAATYEIDQAKGTHYHENLKKIVTMVQEEDLRFAVAVMDARGNRRLRPSEQEDPDLYVRVVDKNDKGIIVRGAKGYVSDPPVTHFMLVMPSRVMGPEDRSYAVSFVVPTDAPGITYICSSPRAPREKLEYERPVSQISDYVECITIFDDVFIPWENVLMCEEWEFTPNLLHYFATYARFTKCTCTSARIDLLAGITSLLAKANGIEKASHVREKILEMVTSSQMGYACAKGALSSAWEHPSGIAIPDFGSTSAGLYMMRQGFPRFLGHIHDIGGGLVLTAPGEKTYTDPRVRPLIDRFLKGAAEIPTEHRLRAFYLARDLVGSDLTGYLMCSVLDAAGGIEPNKVDIRRSYDLEEKEEIAKQLAGIKD